MSATVPEIIFSIIGETPYKLMRNMTILGVIYLGSHAEKLTSWKGYTYTACKAVVEENGAKINIKWTKSQDISPYKIFTSENPNILSVLYDRGKNSSHDLPMEIEYIDNDRDGDIDSVKTRYKKGTVTEISDLSIAEAITLGLEKKINEEYRSTINTCREQLYNKISKYDLGEK